MTESSQNLWFVDLTDFVNFAIWTGRVSGIQRVEYELIRALRDRDDLHVFSTFDGIYWNMTEVFRAPDLTVDALIGECRRRHPLHVHSNRTVRNVIPAVQRAFLKMRPTPSISFGDKIIVAGAFWEVDKVYKRCLKARSLGLDIVLVLYDLIPIDHVEMLGHNYTEKFRRLLQIPTHLCCISKYTAVRVRKAIERGDIAEPQSLRITPLAHEFPGFARDAAPCMMTDDLRTRIGDRAFVLCVGTVEIRKNHDRLLDAWEELSAIHGDSLPLLVIAGRRGWKAEKTLARIEAMASSVVFAESPDDAELAALYGGCLFTVFPSTFEGWGLPVGESHWFGKACASSNASTLPEVGGDLCVYFDPLDVRSLRDAVEALLDDVVRVEVEARIRHAALRTWADVGSDMSDVVRHLSGPCRVGRISA